MSQTGEENSKKPPVYQRWQVELARVCGFLPLDDKVHEGLRLVDGANVKRHEAAKNNEQKGRRGEDESE